MTPNIELLILVILSVIFYSSAILLQTLVIAGKFEFRKISTFITGLPAIILHGYLLYHWIDVAGGQNLSIFNVFSLIMWLIALLTVITTLRKPIENLALFVFPLAIISIFLAELFPKQSIIDTAQDPKLLVHIILSILTLSILSIAGLQAILLAAQEHHLHSKRSSLLVKKLPAIETMEKILFETITIGFFLLSIVLITSTYYFHKELLPVFFEKTLFSALAWLAFAIVLGGRCFFGWRGHKIIHYTLAGVVLLILAYFGTKLLMEYFA